jgi:hypothetical protein
MQEANDTAEFTVSQRTNLALQNMLAAARFSRRVAELEDSNNSQPFRSFWEEILHNSIASVMCCSSSLEAYANELFFEREAVFPKFSAPLLDKLWETYERKTTLEKFELLCFSVRNRASIRGQPHIKMFKLSSSCETLSFTSSRNGILRPIDTRSYPRN